jgi:uncharacterized protein
MSKVLAGLFLLIAASAHATSFDCSKAKTKIELAICTSPDLSKADEQMAVAYKKALTELPSEYATQLHDDQRTWLEMRSTVCSSVADTFQKKEQQNGLRDCLKSKYSDRTSTLNTIHQKINGIEFIQQTKTLFSRDNQPDEVFRKTWPYGTLTANWPVAMSSEPEWQSWNKAIRAAMFQVLNASQGEVKLTDWPAKWDGLSDDDLDVTVKSVNDQYVTASVWEMWYGHGAAHPNRNWIQFNWLRKEQRELRAEDLFKRDSAWEKALLDKCNQDLAKKLKVVGFQDSGNEVDEYIKNPENWTLTTEGLTIEWQPYAVACYACTPDPTTIPLQSLKDYLQPGFQLPQ